MSYTCEIKEHPAQPTLIVRARASVAELPALLGRTFGKIAGYLGELGEQPAAPPFVAYHNTDMSDLVLEIGFPVARPLEGRGDIQASEIPAGQMAGCMHVGPFDEIGAAYEALTSWLGEQGREPAGVAYEFYLDDPEVTPQDQLRTKIAFPLK